MTDAIVVDNVTRSFGGRAVLRGATASAAPGKVVGLLGRNGEGKTTLFKILLDLLAADAGETRVLGVRPDGTGAVRQWVGYVPERPAFHDFMTAAEVFELRSRFFRRWSSDKARALSRELGLEPSTSIRGASKGTLGKIAWVCAAAHDPPVFLLDEPTSGLDALVREEVLNQMIGELHETGKTILIANHRMEELAGVLDEVWVLAAGRIAAVHDMDTLRTQACRITGRLKDGLRPPADLPVVSQPGQGPVVDWAVFDRAAAERVASLRLLEGMDRAPLPVEETLKLLLRRNTAVEEEVETS